MLEWMNKYIMKIAIQYTMYVLLRYDCALYYCITGEVLLCRVKIHLNNYLFVSSE